MSDISERGKTEEQLLVYVAGPYTHGEWGTNIRNAIEEAQILLEEGHVPFIPHTMTGLWSIQYQNDWLEFDFCWLEECDAMVRIEGFSEGSDQEEEFAEENDIPVYDSAADLLNEEGSAYT